MLIPMNTLPEEFVQPTVASAADTSPDVWVAVHDIVVDPDRLAYVNIHAPVLLEYKHEKEKVPTHVRLVNTRDISIYTTDWCLLVVVGSGVVWTVKPLETVPGVKWLHVGVILDENAHGPVRKGTLPVPGLMLVRSSARPEWASRTKEEVFNQRLANDWRNLAGVLSLSIEVQRTFKVGKEPADLWNYLASSSDEEGNNLLWQLPNALRQIERADLTLYLVYGA